MVANPRRYYTLIDENDRIMFTGTVNDAVKQGLFGTISAFRTFVSVYNEGRIVKSHYPFDNKFCDNLKATRCLLEAGCKMYANGSVTPCCYECAFRDGCRERCKNTRDKCGCEYHGCNVQGWTGKCISDMES